MRRLTFTIRPVLHLHPHLLQFSKFTQLPRSLGVTLDFSLFLTLDTQPIRKSQLIFKNITVPIFPAPTLPTPPPPLAQIAAQSLLSLLLPPTAHSPFSGCSHQSNT